MLIGKNKANVPPQVLDDIFKFVERVCEKPEDESFFPDSSLHPLLFVCKEWHEIAERRLYWSVSLGEEKTELGKGGRKVVKKVDGEKVWDMFYRTVHTNQRLASLVRELRLGTMNLSSSDTEWHIAVINVCKKVGHIEIAGYTNSPKVLDKLKATLAAKANLLSLIVSEIGLMGNAECFCTCTDLITYLLSWPRLEKINLDSGCLARHPIPYNTLLELSSAEGRCRKLRDITICSDWPEAVPPLGLLSKMAPEVQIFNIRVFPENIVSLRKCIEAWSPTLTHLYLHYLVPYEERVSLAPVCASLTGLRHLDTSSWVITPPSFVHFVQLESCHYFVTTKDAEELAHVVQKRGVLPSLQEMACDSMYWSGDASPESIQKLRKAFMARNITFVNFISNTNE